MTGPVAPGPVRIESLGEPMTTTHATNTDLIDRLVDVPLTLQEAGQALAYYLPLVVDNSPADAAKDWYLVARLHCGALVGKYLDQTLFCEAAWVGEEITRRRNGEIGDCTYEDWTLAQLIDDLSTSIDQLIGVAQ